MPRRSSKRQRRSSKRRKRSKKRWAFPSKLPTASTFYPRGTMTKSTKRIYEVSKNRKYAPGGDVSAIRWLTYYLNRGGKGIPQDQRKRIEKARELLQRDNNKRKHKRSRGRYKQK